jgi:hypothetical protein
MPFCRMYEPEDKREPDPEKVMELYRSGLSTNNIGKKLGFHKSRIAKIVKAAGELRFRRLTDAERATAVEKYLAGESAPTVAEQLGVTSPAIYLALEKSGVPRRLNSDYSKEEAIRHDFFRKIDTREKAYWLGFLLTDGCVTREGEIIISLKGSDAAHLELWRKAVGSKRKITVSGKPKSFEGYNWFCETARFVIKSDRMAADLFGLGVTPAKTGHTIYPKQIPAEFEADFWRGAVDGDGWLCWVKSGKRQQLVLGFTGDLPVVQAFRSFVVRNTPTAAQVTRNGLKLSKFQVTDTFAYTVADVLYREAPVYLHRKHNVFVNAQQRALPTGRSLN